LYAGSALALGLGVALTLTAEATISAHRLDEYLQAARIDLQPAGVLIDLDLTPGAALAESFVTSIDRSGDGSMSAEEQRAYANEVVSALEIELDGEPLPLRLKSSTFPAISAFRRGEGSIRLQVGASHPVLSGGAHQLFFRNGHLGGQSVYLANALAPQSDRISVARQRRDGHQRELRIDFAVRGESIGSTPAWLLVGVTAAALRMGFNRRMRLS
jgi:hypothetical protein